MVTREKFTTRVDSKILANLRNLARIEGQQLQTLVDEALADLIDKRQQGNPRQHVISAYQSSHTAFQPLYQKLAKAEDIINRYSQTLDQLAK